MQRDASQTPAYKLFHWKYQCRIPEMVVLSPAVLDNFGTFVSGDEGRDVSNAKHLVGALRTVAELATIHGQGFKVEVDDDEKAFEMYTHITEHIKEAIEYQSNGMFGKMAPIEDLQTFDKFASYIFPRVRHHFVAGTDDSSRLMSHLSSRLRKSRTKEKTAPEAHVSLTTKIDVRQLTGSRNWK